MPRSSKSDTSFKDEIMAEPGGEKLVRCFSCGTCTASCPIRWVNEKYNPRRIIKMVEMGMEKRVLSNPFIWFCSACDLCYRYCPQGVKISDLMKAIRNIATREGYEPPRAIAQVNERTCVGCGLCIEVCPYDAIELVNKRVLGREKVIAQVDRFLCMECGICAASCRSGAIDIVDFSDEALFLRIRGIEEEALLPVEATI